MNERAAQCSSADIARFSMSGHGVLPRSSGIEGEIRLYV